MTGHVRQRSPGSWEIRYSAGPDPSGKRKTATATVRGSRKDAEKELRRLLHSVDAGAHVDPSRMTARDWFAAWLTEVRPAVAQRSHQRYEETVRLYLAPALGNVPVAKLTAAHVQRAYNAWGVGGRGDGRAGGLSPSARRYCHKILRMALSRAVELQLITRNPCDVFRRRLPRSERREMVILSPSQSRQLLDAAGPLYMPILLALTTGARRGEVLGLRWCNVELGDGGGLIRIVESLEQVGGELRSVAPKGGKVRSVTLPSFVIAELRQRKLRQAETLLRLGVSQAGDTRLCVRDDGQVPTPGGLTAAFRRLIRSIEGFPQIHFHSLRHTHATELLASGVHPKVASERLGHATIAMTLDLYSHVTESMQVDAAAKIDAIFQRK
jgi:integrase